jgi:hypothetical protein
VLAALDDVLFDIRIEDQDHSARLLREGAVMGAVTTERTPVYIKRYLADGFTAHAMSEVPSLAWNRDDALQDMLVRKAFRRDIARPQHFVPIAEGFGAAVRNGRGGGCFLIASQRRILTTAHSCGSQMRTSTSRCTGSAGNSTARSSTASPKRCILPLRSCANASREPGASADDLFSALEFPMFTADVRRSYRRNIL